MIEFAIQNELPLKLLPQIGLEGSDKFKDQIYPILNRYATTICDKGTGATAWNVEKMGIGLAFFISIRPVSVTISKPVVHLVN